MSHPVEIQIEHHMSIDELKKRIKTLENDTKVLRRLYFIKYRYEGKLVSESSTLVGVNAGQEVHRSGGMKVLISINTCLLLFH